MPESSRRVQALRAFQNALDATTKTIEVQIGDQDFLDLKDSGYRLCFAKKVEGADSNADANIVWLSYGVTEYLQANQVSWTPQFQLFATSTFEPGSTILGRTNLQSIGLGEASNLNKEGQLESPFTSGPSGAITLNNGYVAIHPGLYQLAIGVDGKQASEPIYVVPQAILAGDLAAMTPTDQVVVWFEHDIETGVMFDSPRSLLVEVDLTDVPQATRLYKDGSWSDPG